MIFEGEENTTSNVLEGTNIVPSLSKIFGRIVTFLITLLVLLVLYLGDFDTLTFHCFILVKRGFVSVTPSPFGDSTHVVARSPLELPSTCHRMSPSFDCPNTSDHCLQDFPHPPPPTFGLSPLNVIMQGSIKQGVSMKHTSRATRR